MVLNAIEVDLPKLEQAESKLSLIVRKSKTTTEVDQKVHKNSST